MSRPPALRPLQCPHPDCTFPEGGRCARASEVADPLLECTDLLREDATPAASARDVLRAVEPPHSDAAPWSGQHLGGAELRELLSASPARLIGVLGPFNAGKTSLLTAFFLQLASGQPPDFPFRFASGRSLQSLWQLAARAHDWSGYPDAEIVGHTPTTVGLGRQLHLGLKPAARGDDRHIDVLFSDLPGEWITGATSDAGADQGSGAVGWIDHSESPQAEQLAFLRRCSAFLVVADAGVLASEQGRAVDRITAAILQRLCDLPPAATPRALALVLNKYDLVYAQAGPPPADGVEPGDFGPLARGLRRSLTALRAAREAGTPARVFAASAFPGPLSQGQPIGVMPVFRFLLEQADDRTRWPRLPWPEPAGRDSFLALRRRELSP